jgi:hypothetical protein
MGWAPGAPLPVVNEIVKLCPRTVFMKLRHVIAK